MKRTNVFSHVYKIFLRVTALMLVSLILSCTKKEDHSPSVIFQKKDNLTAIVYDLPQIQECGTLIGITLSGPETYYEYRGEEFGTQFRIAQAFAQSIGVRLQMETAPDTATLVRLLEDGHADLICLELEKETPWKTRGDCPLLTKALSDWWDPKRNKSFKESLPENQTIPLRRFTMKDRRRGLISDYDDLFIRHCKTAGWDWRLLAAQCHQESGFDPQATSWAGAKGLMQLMPSTAKQFGVMGDDIFNPEKNIAVACRYIRLLNVSFKDIADPFERIHFVLAAYNGGALHVRDAMTLARMQGLNDHSWKQVAPYILRLADPEVYRRPEVKHGYMRGSETEQYVRAVIQRWNDYRKNARSVTSGSVPLPARRNVKDGKFQSKVIARDSFAAQ